MPDEAPSPSTQRAGVPDPLADLSRAAMAGDEAAFASIHGRLDDRLRRFLLRRAPGRDDLAADLAQRTWVAVWEALRQARYDPNRAAISTFVYAVASKMWLQHLRTSRRAGPAAGLSDDDEGLIADAAGPADAMDLAEVLDAVRACLRADASADGLSQEESVIVCAAASGESDRALAKRLGLAPSTINARKRAAYDKVRRYLARRGHRPESSERHGPDRE